MTSPPIGRRGPTPVSGRDFNPDEGYFAALSERFGEEALALRIGPILMRLEGLSRGQASRLARRFRPFVTQIEEGAGRNADLAIEIKAAGVDQFLAEPRDTVEIYRMNRRASAGRLTLWSYEFAGWVEPSRRRALLSLVEPEGPRFDRGLENFLRVLTASFILERGGLLVHGSGIVRGGRAYIFFGPSGSGKTTVTHLSPNDTILSDDLTLLIAGEGGYRAAGIPFGMAHHRTPHTNDSFPIASLNRLVQSERVGRERIDGARALAELAGSLPFVMEETGEAARALGMAGRVLESVPAYRLRFRRDDTFWPLVEGESDGSE